MTTYTIRVDGHLDPHWAAWFAGLALRHEYDGTTTLCGNLPDQSALFGVLNRIHDLNLPLLAVERENPNHPGSTIATHAARTYQEDEQ